MALVGQCFDIARLCIEQMPEEKALSIPATTLFPFVTILPRPGALAVIPFLFLDLLCIAKPQHPYTDRFVSLFISI